MILDGELAQDYFRWLTNTVISSDLEALPVLYILHSRDYYPMLIMDNSRASDGVRLRDEYIQERNGDYALTLGANPWNDIQCSFLEMMIALAKRMTIEFYSDDDGTPWYITTKIFDNMLLSMGIYGDITEEEINEKVNTFMQRSYEPTGAGSLFDLTGCTKDIDWRVPPIWNQMLAWISTHYVVDEE